MPWVKNDCSFDTDSKILKLEVTGRAIIQYVWRQVKIRGTGGIVSADILDIDSLKFMNGIKEPNFKVEQQVKKLFEVGLIVDSGDFFEIPNWKEYQTDTTATDRKRRQRERLKAEPSVTDVTRDQRDVTVSRAVTDVTLKRRGEERRGEEKNIIKKEAGDGDESQSELPSIPKAKKKATPKTRKLKQVELRDDRAKLFADALKQTEIFIGKGRVAYIADVVADVNLVANNLSDESSYPGMKPLDIKEAAQWTITSGNPREGAAQFLTGWFKRGSKDNAPGRPSTTGTKLDPSSSAWLPYAGSGQ